MSGATAPPLAVLGAGSLARTLLAGWRRAGVRFGSLTTVSRTRARAAELVAPGVRALSVDDDSDAAAAAVRGARVVLVAVKPWMVAEILDRITGALEPDAVVVSVVAGVRLRTLRAALPDSVAVVRVLPNTPSQVNRGVAGIASGSADRGSAQLVRELFEVLGEVVPVDEDGLDALTVVTGSAPAFVFLFIEQLTAAMVAQGFAPEDAARMARQVFLGASELLADTGEDPAELRRRVTSPNGVTQRALAVFEERGLQQLLLDAVDAGLARARELAGASVPTAPAATEADAP